MITTNDLPEVKLKNLLSNLGLLSGLTIDGAAIDDPQIQLTQLVTSRAQKNERIICLMCFGLNNSGSSDVYTSHNASFIVTSQEDRGDMINARMIATYIQNELKTFVADDDTDCDDIFGITVNGITGPYYEKDDRVSFELSLTLLIN